MPSFNNGDEGCCNWSRTIDKWPDKVSSLVDEMPEGGLLSVACKAFDIPEKDPYVPPEYEQVNVDVTVKEHGLVDGSGSNKAVIIIPGVSDISSVGPMGGAHGDVTVALNGDIVYTLNKASDATSDTIVLMVIDSTGKRYEVTVNVTIINDTPTMVLDGNIVSNELVRTFKLKWDYGADTWGGQQRLYVRDDTSGKETNISNGATIAGTYGTLIVNADGSCVYTFKGNVSGTDKFSFFIVDADGDKASTTISLSYTKPETPPDQPDEPDEPTMDDTTCLPYPALRKIYDASYKPELDEFIAGTTTTISGIDVTIGRHISDKGALVRIPSSGKMRSIFVADACYRRVMKSFPAALSGLAFPDIRNLQENTFFQVGNNNYSLALFNTSGYCTATPTLSHDDYIDRFLEAVYQDNMQELLTKFSYSASLDTCLFWCNSVKISDDVYCRLPTLFELTVLYLFGPQIDAIDPTLTKFPFRALTSAANTVTKYNVYLADNAKANPNAQFAATCTLENLFNDDFTAISSYYMTLNCGKISAHLIQTNDNMSAIPVRLLNEVDYFTDYENPGETIVTPEQSPNIYGPGGDADTPVQDDAPVASSDLDTSWSCSGGTVTRLTTGSSITVASIGAKVTRMSNGYSSVVDVPYGSKTYSFIVFDAAYRGMTYYFPSQMSPGKISQRTFGNDCENPFKISGLNFNKFYGLGVDSSTSLLSTTPATFQARFTSCCFTDYACDDLKYFAPYASKTNRPGMYQLNEVAAALNIRCRAPNIFEIMSLLFCAEAIDTLDPTVAANPLNALSYGKNGFGNLLRPFAAGATGSQGAVPVLSSVVKSTMPGEPVITTKSDGTLSVTPGAPINTSLSQMFISRSTTVFTMTDNTLYFLIPVYRISFS